MTKKFSFVLLVALVVALLPAGPLFACKASCVNGSCSGTGTCSCVGDDPVCSDTEQSASELVAQASYARGFNTPGLNRFADVTEKIANARATDDKQSYFLGLLEREEVLKSLSAKERQILNSWAKDTLPTPVGARQK